MPVLHARRAPIPFTCLPHHAYKQTSPAHLLANTRT